MIELRWLVRPIPNYPTFGPERVLQYRTVRFTRIRESQLGDGDQAPMFEFTNIPSYSDWRDVQTVEDT